MFTSDIGREKKKLKTLFLTVASLILINQVYCFSVRIRPDTVVLNLPAGRSVSGPTFVDISGVSAEVTKVDIIFAFDTTGSMGGIIDEMKANAITIMSDILAMVPDTQFAVISYGDYPVPPYGYPSSGDYPYRLEQVLTSDQAAIQEAINNLDASGGEDEPEAYTRAFYESYAELIGETNPTYGSIGARPGAKRIVIDFGDSIPHDNNLNEGVPGKTGTRDTGVDLGRDEIAGTSDDLDLQTVLSTMGSLGVALLEVHSSVSDVEYWQYWTGLTGGGFAAVSSPSDIHDAIMTLLQTQMIGKIRPMVSTIGYGTWMSWDPTMYQDIQEKTYPFTQTVSVPVGTQSGVHWVVSGVAVESGQIYGTQNAIIFVLPETGRYGKLLYTKNVVRDVESGEITSTGNIFIKDIETKSEVQITNYSSCIIRNPTFSGDGSEIIYTSNISGSWKIYIINRGSFVGNPDQGTILDNGNQHPYATLSPDKKLIAYVEINGLGCQLSVYNRTTKQKTLILNNRNLQIFDLTFINEGMLAFKGVYNGIQDIYTVGLDGTNLTNLTNNTAITPQYGRLTFGNVNTLFYAKRVYTGFGYGKWDLFIRNIYAGQEVNISNTAELDEYDPKFVSTENFWAGHVFYSGNEIGIGHDCWSMRFAGAWDSGIESVKMQWTGSFTTTEYAGQIDFISASALIPEAGRVINVQDTRIVYTAGGNKVIYRSDNDGTNWDNPGTAISTISVDKFVSDMDSTGGKIIYGFDSVPQTLIRANHDGSGEVTFAQGTSAGNEIKDACWSPDGRWVVFVKREKINKYGIYAKMANQDTAQVDTPLLTDISSTDVQHPSFSPDGTMLVFSKRDIGGTYDIYTLGIKTDDGTSIYPGTLKQITYTPAISEMQPSYSPDGKKIIFLSDNPAGINQIYTTDTNGSSRELVVEGGQNLNINYPLFGDVNVETNIYYIGYVSDNPASGTRTIKIARLPKIDPTPGDGENLATLYQDTGLEPTNDKFIWGIKREKGTIVAQRNLSKRTAKNQDFQYSVVIDVDETIMLNGYTLEEIITADFLTSDIFVSIDGSAFSAPVVYDDSPSQGYRTIKIAFSPFQNGGVKDHTVRIKMKAPNSTGIQPIEGDIKYMIDGIANTAVISGNSSISISSPFIPVDVYTLENEEGSDGIIGDWDLLYAIDAWTNSRQLSGFGIKWPEDIENWDGILLALIDIWASPAGTKGTHTGGSASTASSVPGEYQYIGLYVYTPPAVGKSEMYWTQGKWLE